MRKISKFQKSELLKKYYNRDYTIFKRSVAALYCKNLIDQENNLTENGINTVISMFPLHKQAASLGIKIQEYEIHCISAHPEYNLLHFLEDKSKSCIWTEGWDVLLGIHACALGILKRLNHFGKEDAINRYIIAQFTICQKNKVEITNYIKKCNLDEYMESYRSVYKGICLKQDFSKITETHMYLLYNYIIEQFKLPITELLFNNPYKFGKGWPDLTVFHENSFSLIEVKHRDKLIRSQIETIPKLINIGIPIIIGKVKYIL